MSEKKAVVVQDYDVSGTALEVYGQRAMVRELTERLLGLHPAAKDVGQPGMLAVAQLAILIGANPLPSTNEIHVWTDKGTITVDLGINYFRRRARDLGGILWDFEPRIMTDQEYTTYGIDARTEIGAICRACRVSDVKVLMEQLDVPGDLAFEQAMKRSARTGTGTVSVNARPKKGRPLSWTALKAAEKDVCRALFPNLETVTAEERDELMAVVPHYEPGDENWGGETLNGHEAENLANLREATERAEKVMQVKTPEEQAAKVEENDKLLNGDHDDNDPFGIDDLQPGDTPDLTNATAEDLYGPADEPEHAEEPLVIEHPTALLEALAPLEYYKNGKHALNALNKIEGTSLKTWPMDDPSFYVRAFELLTAYAQEQTAQQGLPGM